MVNGSGCSCVRFLFGDKSSARSSSSRLGINPSKSALPVVIDLERQNYALQSLEEMSVNSSHVNVEGAKSVGRTCAAEMHECDSHETMI